MGRTTDSTEDKIKPIAIILPCYNSGRHLRYAIDSILESISYPIKLFLIESESTDGTDLVCDGYVQRYPDIIQTYHIPKKGITMAINFGIDKAGDMDVYLTQDDVIHFKLYNYDWIYLLKRTAENDNCGLVTTFGAGGIAGEEYLKGFPWCGTWSMFIPRETINKIGKFDEAYSPGPGDDIDFTYRVIQAKLHIFAAPFWVDHHRLTEHQNDLEDIKQKNALYFRKKFGFIKD